MNAGTLLSRLESVKQTGPGRWLAKCPAHDDKSPSLSIRELDDGRILIHRFAQCGGDAIMRAAGLTLADLYPEPLSNKRERPAPLRQRVHPADALKALAHEACLVGIVASDIAGGKQISDEDTERCAVAAGRINAAVGGSL